VNSPRQGRPFFFNPGPTNIPDRVLHAIAQPTMDFFSPEFMEIHRYCHAALMRVLKTRQHLFVYASTGHGAWEASLVNVFAPGDLVLILESGFFSERWAAMAEKFGLRAETLPADWNRGVEVADLQARLAADTKHEIKGVLAVHNETATGMTNPVAGYRKAMDAAKHPALLLADTISSLASIDFRMDEWGVDVAVGGGQKGLMQPTGLAFTGVSEKALKRSKENPLPRKYLDWQSMVTREPQDFPGTVPVHLFYGLREGLRMLEEEGLDAVFARHARFGEATRRAVAAWGEGGDGPRLFCQSPDRLSNSVTAVEVPDGIDANALRQATTRYNLSLGGGLTRLNGKVFRIGHMGDMNEPMLLGALATIELAMKATGVPFRKGGVDAAVAYLAAS
jgi:alanine-glyoxylate transaminase/serine-glyoxylate transaminase/serine-pyruvate transaminase